MCPGNGRAHGSVFIEGPKKPPIPPSSVGQGVFVLVMDWVTLLVGHGIRRSEMGVNGAE